MFLSLFLFLFLFFFFFFFNDTATTEIYTLSLHDALPILRTLTSGDREAALVQFEPPRAGDALGGAGGGGVERRPLGGPPAPVVYQVGVTQGQLVLEAQRAAVEHQLLELAVRGVQQGPARCLVHATGLHADQAVLDDVGPADAVLASDGVERLEQLDGTERHAIHGDRRPLLEPDLDDGRQLRRLERVACHDEDVLRGVVGGVFQDAAFMRTVPQVAVGGVRLLQRGLHRDRFRFHVRDQVLPAVELPFAPRRDHLQLRRERRVGELEAHLIVALAGAAVRHGLSSGALGKRHLMRSHGGAGPGAAAAEWTGGGRRRPGGWGTQN